VNNKDWFFEKTEQVSGREMTAFGVDISSRHGRANEIKEMLDFMHVIAKNCLENHIASVFYDSGSCCCNISLKPEYRTPESDAAIRHFAVRTISQIDWFGTILHGDALDPDFEE